MKKQTETDHLAELAPGLIPEIEAAVATVAERVRSASREPCAPYLATALSDAERTHLLARLDAARDGLALLLGGADPNAVARALRGAS